MGEKRRISILGLIKFIAAVAIVYYHMVDLKSEHWGSLFLLVELFFFITGYFTYKHFDKINDSDKISLEEKGKRAIKYTFNKIKPLMPYIVIAVVLHGVFIFLYGCRTHNVRDGLLNTIIKSTMDILLLGSQVDMDNWALWFMSAMVIAMPAFCIVCQFKQKSVNLVIFCLMAIAFYFNTPNLDVVSGAGAIIRAFVGLAMGGAIYVIVERILESGCRKSRLVKVLLSVLGVGVFVFSFIMMYPARNSLNLRQCQSLTVVLFAIFMVLLMSRQTVLTNISSKVMNFLEKMSMVLFFIHQPIIQIVSLRQPLNTLQIRGLLIIGCIIISCILYLLVSFLLRLRLKKGIEALGGAKPI